MTHSGSPGEQAAQQRFGTRDRACTFYDRQFLTYLNPRMVSFIQRQQMVFVATADAAGECDSSFRGGDPGFVRVFDARTVLYPEIRGNGVLASLGNIAENPQIALMFIDFGDCVGLHVNGRAQVVETADLTAAESVLPGVRVELDRASARRPERWVRVYVQEAYIHCSKHIPRMVAVDRGDAPVDPDGVATADYFAVRRPALDGT